MFRIEFIEKLKLELKLADVCSVPDIKLDYTNNFQSLVGQHTTHNLIFGPFFLQDIW